MTTAQPVMWEAIFEKMPREKWIPIVEIFGIVKNNVPLQKDDFDPATSGKCDSIRWESNVRSMLQYRNMTGEILGDRKGNYFIPGI